MMRPVQPEGSAQPITIDRDAVGRCFGCGQANEHGFRMTFARYPDGTVESRHRTAPHHCGVDTVVHGGIQATLLDEVMGVAARPTPNFIKFSVRRSGRSSQPASTD